MVQPVRSTAEWARDMERKETDLQKRLQYTRIPAHLRHLGWESYEPGARTPENESLRDILIDYADHWTSGQREGLVLLGKPGVGKTRGLVTLGIDLCCRGVMVRYSTYADLVEERKALITAERHGDATGDYSRYERQELRIWLAEEECDLLLLDDVGKEYRSDSKWSDAGLDLLLRRRGAAGKVTCIASNLTLDDWTRYNEAMASFLYELGEVVVCDGPDRRKRRTEGARRRAVTRAGR